VAIDTTRFEDPPDTPQVGRRRTVMQQHPPAFGGAGDPLHADVITFLLVRGAKPGSDA
jgi:hypothetical protein